MKNQKHASNSPTVQQIKIKSPYIIYIYLIIRYLLYIGLLFLCWTLLDKGCILLDAVGRTFLVIFFCWTVANYTILTWVLIISILIFLLDVLDASNNNCQ